ncbi:MAG: 4-hydroxy-tetrahydrodipicolinate reductase [Chitinophagaceae bacterium]|nr:4-hydroxy-tetrahydrodipicolinate reductase [Chitinophagaceae bacterium]
MRIALIGYGKMGKAIEEVAIQRGHKVEIRIDQPNLNEFTKENMADIDAAIEFTSPHSAYDNVKKCLEFNVPVVCGSTGWTERLGELKQLSTDLNGAFVYSSNYSVGVNIFFEINKKLAALMAPHHEYEVILEEIHHTAKKDAPSGTAITLAEDILKQVHRKKQWVNELSDNPEDLEIISQRIDPTPGTHSVKYSSVIDNIEIIHTAHNRTGFATGSVIAAEFLFQKKGFYTMKDVLGL